MRPDTQKRTLILNTLTLYNSHKNALHIFFPQKKWGSFRMREIENGYLPRTDTITPQNPEQRIEKWDPQSVSALKELIENLQKDGIDIILIQIPNFAPGYNKEIESKTQIQKISDEYNIPYLDYNQTKSSLLNYDASLFADWGHLNTTGATVFSSILQQDLRKILD